VHANNFSNVRFEFEYEMACLREERENKAWGKTAGNSGKGKEKHLA
jgi:hypothetical protein